MRKKIPVAGYVLALICFALPFVQVSCAGQKIATLSGFDLVTGTTITVTENTPPSRTPPSTPAVLALLLVIAGIVLGLIARRGTVIAAAICGVVGAASLMTLASSEMANAPPSANGLLTIDYQFGFYLAVLLMFGSGVLLLVFEFLGGKRVVAAPVGMPAVAPAPPPAPSPPVLAAAPPAPPEATAEHDRFCAVCGQAIPPGSHFCAACGHPVH